MCGNVSAHHAAQTPRRRLNKVSDGQRRRVQICMGLLRPYQVLGLDWLATVQSCCVS